jgi:hypothetical protein
MVGSGATLMRAQAVVVALAVGITACSDDEADPNEPREEPVLEVATDTGEPVCMLVSEDLPPEVEKLPVIGCDVRHTHEIYAAVEYDVKDVYPGVEELSAFAQVECLNSFEPFVGRSQFDSQLSYTWLVPSLDGWNSEDDREVLCVLADRAGADLTGSMRSSNA